MFHDDIIRQITIEHELLGHVTQALRTTMRWDVEGDDCSRKHSTVQFVAQSFQRHLYRLLRLEEHDGYMDMLAECSPQLFDQIQELRQEHDGFRAALDRLIPRLEQVRSSDTAEFDLVCDELRRFLDALDEHRLKETYLIQEGLLQEVGGEG